MMIKKENFTIMTIILKIIKVINSDILSTVNRVVIFTIKTLYHCITPPYYFEIIVKQLIYIGFFSLPIVAFASVFTGAVLMLQTNLYSENTLNLVTSNLMPGIVLISIVRELGPVLISLILAGRISSGIASEIGIMRITDQIDALSTLNTNPFKYLIAPRVIATVVSIPLLIFCMDIIGIFGGYIIAVYNLNYYSSTYINSIITYLKFDDIILGLIKSIIFGFTLSLTGCYHGYYCGASSQDVGRATTLSVIISSILIILLNYIITFIAT